MSEAVVILAAGSGSRFLDPCHKLRSKFRDKAVLSWVLEAAEQVDVDERIIVVGAVELEDLIGPTWTILANADWEQGMATSLAVALNWSQMQGHRAVTVGLGDQPGITAAAWKLVLSKRNKPITVATYGGQRRNPVRLERSVWDLMPVGGDEGARSVIASMPQLVDEVACEGSSFDIDTVEDLKKWK